MKEAANLDFANHLFSSSRYWDSPPLPSPYFVAVVMKLSQTGFNMFSDCKSELYLFTLSWLITWYYIPHNSFS
jgi:hypothetical protein